MSGKSLSATLISHHLKKREEREQLEARRKPDPPSTKWPSNADVARWSIEGLGGPQKLTPKEFLDRKFLKVAQRADFKPANFTGQTEDEVKDHLTAYFNNVFGELVDTYHARSRGAR